MAPHGCEVVPTHASVIRGTSYSSSARADAVERLSATGNATNIAVSGLVIFMTQTSALPPVNNFLTAPLALYIHWPFCVSKCPYCDFNSHVRASVDQAAWREALLEDLAHEAAAWPRGR